MVGILKVLLLLWEGPQLLFSKLLNIQEAKMFGIRINFSEVKIFSLQLQE